MTSQSEKNPLKKSNISAPVDGILHVTLTKNNSILTLTDLKGDVLSWTTCRNCGFHGSQKTTPIATITAAEEIGLRAIDSGMKKVNVVFKGKPRFRNAILRGLARSKVPIHQFILVPAIPYNGCRLEKKGRK